MPISHKVKHTENQFNIFDELGELLHFAQNAIQMICVIEIARDWDKDLFIYSHSLK